MWRFWWWRNIFLIISWFLFRMKRKEIFSQHDGMIPIWIDDGTKNKWSTKVNFMDFSFTYKKVQRIKMTKNSITFSKNIYTFPEFKIVLLHEIIMVIFMKWRYWHGFFTILAKWSIFYNWQALFPSRSEFFYSLMFFFKSENFLLLNKIFNSPKKKAFRILPIILLSQRKIISQNLIVYVCILLMA